ncbi:hypothetical protein QTP88_026643 [Uroleucon formosanum]
MKCDQGCVNNVNINKDSDDNIVFINRIANFVIDSIEDLRLFQVFGDELDEQRVLSGLNGLRKVENQLLTVDVLVPSIISKTNETVFCVSEIISINCRLTIREEAETDRNM